MRTPLDLVTAVTQPAVGTVVLVGEFARDRAFAHFLQTSYPGLEVVVATVKDPPPQA